MSNLHAHFKCRKELVQFLVRFGALCYKLLIIRLDIVRTRRYCFGLKASDVIGQCHA